MREFDWNRLKCEVVLFRIVRVYKFRFDSKASRPMKRPVRLTAFTVCVLFSLALGGVTADAGIVASGSSTVRYDFNGFRGAGFSPTPSAGQFDSDFLSIRGFDRQRDFLDFGGSKTSGDFARGTDGNGVSTAGIYAFDVGGGNYTLGFQPNADDLTPGAIIFRLINGGTADITSLRTAFDLYSFNDEPRSNIVEWRDALGDSSNAAFSPIGSFVSTEAPDNNGWTLATSTTYDVGFAPGAFAPGDAYFFGFFTDDVGGSGARDEFAIDSVSFSATFASAAAVPEPASGFAFAGLCGVGLCIRRRRPTKR